MSRRLRAVEKRDGLAQVVDRRVGAHAQVDHPDGRPCPRSRSSVNSSPPTAPGSLTATASDVTQFVGPAAPLPVRIPADNSDADAWKAVVFDDSGWTAGTSGVGYDHDNTVRSTRGSSAATTARGRGAREPDLRTPAQAAQSRREDETTITMLQNCANREAGIRTFGRLQAGFAVGIFTGRSSRRGLRKSPGGRHSKRKRGCVHRTIVSVRPVTGCDPRRSPRGAGPAEKKDANLARPGAYGGVLWQDARPSPGSGIGRGWGWKFGVVRSGGAP